MRFVRFLLLNKDDGFVWNLVIIYGDAQIDDKQAFLIELAQLCHHNKLPMILGVILISRETKRRTKKGGVTNGVFCLMQLLNKLNLENLI